MATLIVAYLVSTCTALAFLTNVSEKHNSISPGAFQVKSGERQSVLKRN